MGHLAMQLKLVDVYIFVIACRDSWSAGTDAYEISHACRNLFSFQ